MNAVEILKYGHSFIENKVSELPEEEWYTVNVVGSWSVKDIIAHLASFETVFVDVLNALRGETETPTLDRFQVDPLRFNDEEVRRRQYLSADEVWAEYVAVHQQAVALLESIPVEGRRLPGTLPWYGAEYSLEDFIVYSHYGHKREHGAQIDVYRDRLRQAAKMAVATA